MKCARFFVISVFLLTSVLSSQPCTAQNYRFATPTMDLEVFVSPDASVRLKYKISFRNQPGAHAIDVVDIGLPHADYQLNTMKANLDGKPLSKIDKSTFIDIGVEVPLGGLAILAGKSGMFVFECQMPDMVYRDTTDNDYASLQIKPTWFDADSQIGTTQLRIAIHLPPGIDREEVRYQSEKLKYNDLVTAGEGDKKHVVARWLFDGHHLSSRNPKIGISFPSRAMQRVVKISRFGLLLRWFSERPELQVGSGIVLVLCLAFLFFRFSGGTGFVVFLILAGLLIFIMLNSPRSHLAAWPIILALIGDNEWIRHRKGSRYLPAMATIEGGGIKRGLTAPQAAVLLELPLSRVLTLVIFGLLKKGVAKTTKSDPLAVEIDSRFRTSRKKRRKIAGELGIVLHDYEQPFVDLLLAKGKAVEQIDFNQPLGRLIKATAGMMKGFDLADTQEYHRRIIARAWTEAAQIGELKQRSAVIDRNVEWMLLDPNADERFGRWHGGGYHYWPSWAGHSTIDSSGRSATAPSTPSAPTETSPGEVASSFAGWTENTSGQLAAAIDPGSLGFDVPSMGLVDFSGVDHVTSEVFKGLAESGGGGGGGGGGGCACACAGCACACACAGGGR